MIALALASAALATKDLPESRRLMADFADCVVRQTPRKAKKFVVGAPFRADDENFRAFMNNCLPLANSAEGVSLMTPVILLRFAFAEAFLRQEKTLGLPPLQSIAPLEHRPAQVRSSKKPGQFEITISTLGECIVRTAPEAATRLVRSEVSTPAETVAFAAIKPAVSKCLSAGKVFAFSSEMLRGTVALNYYRLAAAAGAAQ
jgi:hypothetical protein